MNTQIYRHQTFDKTEFTAERVIDAKFINCDFSSLDLTDTQFINCQFYDQENQVGCHFERAILKDAIFKNCDLTMCNFKYAHALGIEINGCRAQGIDFSGTSFMNMISPKVWFCSAYLTQNNFSYANFNNAVLEKCELWENIWQGANVHSATFEGSDLSGGTFLDFDWRSANFTRCNLTNSILGELDIRSIDLEGVTLDSEQVALLMERLGIIVL